MSNKDDISQLIRKYLNGELDARAMHQLEKEALNDPFLMEALEGYAQSGAEQQQNLADIYARLHDRIHKSERRIIPWKWISVAASVLIILTIGGLWLRQQSPVTNKTVVKVSKQKEILPAAKPTEAAKVEAIVHSPGIAKQIAKNESHISNNISRYTPPIASEANPSEPAPDLAANAFAKVRKDTASLGEVAVVGYGTQKKAITTGSVQTISQGYIGNNAPPAVNELSGKVAGLSVGSNDKSLTGFVKDETNQPIPGATVNIKGTNKTTLTDANGKFVLPDTTNFATLDIAFIGYNRKEISVNNHNPITIAMQPNTSSLNEVVVVGYGTKKQDDEQPLYDGAHPANGWKNFKKYLTDNAESPDDKTGVVKVSFKVNANGSLSDFKIKKGVSTETDNAAIELIQLGTRWISNSNHTAETVTVKVKFEAKK